MAMAKGWSHPDVLETYAHLRLPERGVIGANGLADARHFLAPRAAFEDREVKGYRLTAKLGGQLYEATQDHWPFVVVAWHNTLQGLDALEFGDGFNVLPIPHHPFYFIMAFGSLVFAAVLMVLAWRSARGFPEIKGP